MNGFSEANNPQISAENEPTEICSKQAKEIENSSKRSFQEMKNSSGKNPDWNKDRTQTSTGMLLCKPSNLQKLLKMLEKKLIFEKSYNCQNADVSSKQFCSSDNGSHFQKQENNQENQDLSFKSSSNGNAKNSRLFSYLNIDPKVSSSSESNFSNDLTKEPQDATLQVNTGTLAFNEESTMQKYTDTESTKILQLPKFQQYFKYNFNDLDNIESKSYRISKIKNCVEQLNTNMQNFPEIKVCSSFLYDTLMQLLESLDKIKSKDKPEILEEKIALINYIKSLQATLVPKQVTNGQHVLNEGATMLTT